MVSATEWVWIFLVIVFPIILTIWNFQNLRKGSMFFLAVLFLAESNMAKALVTVLYLIWSIGSHLRYKNHPPKLVKKTPEPHYPIKGGRWSKCPRPRNRTD